MAPSTGHEWVAATGRSGRDRVVRRPHALLRHRRTGCARLLSRRFAATPRDRREPLSRRRHAAGARRRARLASCRSRDLGVRRRRDVTGRSRARAPRRARDRTRALPARCLAPRSVPRRHEAPRRSIRGGPSPESPRGLRPQPAPASVPVSDPPQHTHVPPRRNAESPDGEPVTTVRLASILGAETVGFPDPTEDYHEASRIRHGIVDPLVVGAARLEPSHVMRVSATRSVKRYTQRPFVELPAAATRNDAPRGRARDAPLATRIRGRHARLVRRRHPARRGVRGDGGASMGRRNGFAPPRRVARSTRSSCTSLACGSRVSTARSITTTRFVTGSSCCVR